MTRRPTAIQMWARVLRDLQLDARETLDETTYSWVVALACEVWGTEAAHLAVEEATRATGSEERAA